MHSLLDPGQRSNPQINPGSATPQANLEKRPTIYKSLCGLADIPWLYNHLSNSSEETIGRPILNMETNKQKDFQDSEHVELSQDIFWTEEEEKKLVRKIDLCLLPNIWIMYLLSYMDRTK